MKNRTSELLRFTPAEEREFLAREYESLALKQELEAREHLRRAEDAHRRADRNLKAFEAFEAAVKTAAREYEKLAALGSRIDRIKKRLGRAKGAESAAALAKQYERLVLKGALVAFRVQQATADAEQLEAAVRMDEINCRRLCSLVDCELALAKKSLLENATSLWIAAYGL